MWEARILIVDDQPEIHRGFTELLCPVKDQGIDEINKLAADLFGDDKTDAPLQFPQYHIDSAFSGEEALEMVIEANKSGEPYSLIFMDMRMPPGWDGLKTTQKIWQEVPEVEIVICSAYSDFKWADIQRAVGVTDRLLFVKKPFEVVEVQQMAHALTTKWRMARKLEEQMNALEGSAERSKGLQYLVYQAGAGVNESASSQEALKKIISLIIQETNWEIGHALILDNDDKLKLVSTNLWQSNSEDLELEDIIQVSENCNYFIGSDLPGRALDTQKIVWGEPISILQNKRQSPATDLGIKSVYAFPVVVNNSVQAVLEFFSALPPSEDEQLHSGLSQVLEQLGRSFERHLALNEVLGAHMRAETANKAKSSFLANMSHEIRTPITGIVGFTDLLLESDLSRENRDSVEIVKTCSDALLLLVNDILDLSKIESGQIDLEFIPFNCVDLLYDAVDVVRSKITSNDFELIVNAPNTDIKLLGDPTRLAQVLINLLSNAVKFTKHGEVVCSLELRDHLGGGKTICVSIKDSGIGMTEAQLANIFDPFKQASSTTSRNYGGTGLGLTISKRLIGLMGGGLDVSSELNKGTEFNFELDLEFAPGEQIVELPILECARNKKALIIDSHPMASKALSKQLLECGLNVLACPDIDRACDELLKVNIDFVFVCTSLGSMDGIVKLLKSSATNADLKIIALAKGVLREEHSRDFDGHIFKPPRPHALRGMISRLCGEPQAEVPKVKREASGNSVCVLLVEDNVISQRLVSTFLHKAGHSVKIAENGQQAVEMAGAFSFDMIFMDMELPILNGIEATKQIRVQDSNIPIVAMTANAYAADRESCLNAGMNDYISKPLRRDNVLDMIPRYCGSDRCTLSSQIKRILIVEDEEALRVIMHKRMTKHFPNSAIRTASDGVDACIQLGSFQPHLVIMDISMPNMDGTAVVSYLRQNIQYDKIKIVVVTGLDDDDNKVKRLRQMRIDSLYHKPLNMEVFLNDMQLLLEKESSDV